MKYHYKVWFFTILLAPFVAAVLLWIANSAKPSHVFAITPLLLFAVFFGAIFSLPVLFLLNFLYKDLVEREIQEWKKKIIFGLVGVGLIWVTFYFFDRDTIIDKDLNILIWPILYSGCIIIGSFLFKFAN